MPDASQLVLFVAAGLLPNLTPGGDVLYIASNALRHGTRAGMVAGLGITAGWALAAAWLSRRAALQAGMRWLDRAAGLMLLAFGAKLAASELPRPG